MTQKTNKVRLYRFYNVDVQKQGKPFSMCDRCREKYEIPHNCLMDCIADESKQLCNTCEQKEHSHIDEITQLRQDKAELLGALEHSLGILAHGNNLAQELTDRAHTVRIKVDKGYAISAFIRAKAAIAKATL